MRYIALAMIASAVFWTALIVTTIRAIEARDQGETIPLNSGEWK